MSRNLGRTDCRFCGGDVPLVEAPRALRPGDIPTNYAAEYRGMIVAHAACADCGAEYLGWVAGPPVENYRKVRYSAEGKPLPADLSHRSTFDDEAGPADMPKWKIRIERHREPWPTCVVCKGPVRETYNYQTDEPEHHRCADYKCAGWK